MITTNRYLRALMAAVIALLILATSVSQRLGEAALLVYALTAVLIVAVVVAVWLGFDAAPLWLGFVVGASGLVLVGLVPGGAGVIGVYFAMALVGRKQRHGLAVAIALGVAYVALDLSYRGERFLPAAINAVGLAAVYLGTAGVQRWREARMESVRLEERARLAREIHDLLAHSLTALSVQLESARLLIEKRPDDPEALAAVERAQRLAKDGLEETRRAIGALRGDDAAGPDLLPELAESAGAQLTVEGQARRLSSEAGLALYRTAQEALTNVRKHAPGASVAINLRYEKTGTELVVEDSSPLDGASKEGTKDGYGLVGMRERAELLGGRLEAGPTDGGFRVRLWLPER